MPRAPPTREPCDCLDCLERPDLPPTSAQAAIARQEPPPKSLLIYLHGVIGEWGLDSSGLPHVTALVRDGCSGLLAFTARGVDAAVAAGDLFGVDPLSTAAPETLGQRFKELQAAAMTNSSQVAELCGLAGARPVETLGIEAGGGMEGLDGPWPEPAQLAACIARRLGVPFLLLPDPAAPQTTALAALDAPMPGSSAPSQSQPDNAATGITGSTDGPDDGIDMLLLFLDVSQWPLQQQWRQQQPQQAAVAGAQSGDGAAQAGPEAKPFAARLLEWLDALLMRLNRVEGFRDTVLLTVVLGAQQGPAAGVMAQLRQEQQRLLGAPEQAQQGCREGPRWPFRRPMQSYQFRDAALVEPTPDLAAVVVHRLPGVIRRDAVERLDLEEVQQRGGGGCMLACRLLPEVAYKLGRASKYGA